MSHTGKPCSASIEDEERYLSAHDWSSLFSGHAVPAGEFSLSTTFIPAKGGTYDVCVYLAASGFAPAATAQTSISVSDPDAGPPAPPPPPPLLTAIAPAEAATLVGRSVSFKWAWPGIGLNPLGDLLLFDRFPNAGVPAIQAFPQEAGAVTIEWDDANGETVWWVVEAAGQRTAPRSFRLFLGPPLRRLGVSLSSTDGRLVVNAQAEAGVKVRVRVVRGRRVVRSAAKDLTNPSQGSASFPFRFRCDQRGTYTVRVTAEDDYGTVLRKTRNARINRCGRLRVPFMSPSAARRHARAAAALTFQHQFTGGYGHRLSCARVSRGRFTCGAGWNAGDLQFVGTVAVYNARTRKRHGAWGYRLTVREFDGYHGTTRTIRDSG